MRQLFNSIRTAYFEELADDPQVKALMDREPVHITSPYQLKALCDKAKGYAYLNTRELHSEDFLNDSLFNNYGPIVRCSITGGMYVSIELPPDVGHDDLDHMPLNDKSTTYASLDPHSKTLKVWTDPFKKAQAAFSRKRLAYFDELAEDPKVKETVKDASEHPIPIRSGADFQKALTDHIGYHFWFSSDTLDYKDPSSFDKSIELISGYREKQDGATVVELEGYCPYMFGEDHFRLENFFISIDHENKILKLWRDRFTEKKASLKLSYFDEAVSDIEKDLELSKIVGIKNYTPEIIDKLKGFCEAGWIDSYPEHPYGERGAIMWHKLDGTQHRGDGLPAVESAHAVTYMVDGKAHREDGPAYVDLSTNTKTYEWFIHGQHHREDGPAKIQILSADSIYMEWMKDDKSFFGNQNTYPAEYKIEIERDFPAADSNYWAVDVKIDEGKHIVPKGWNS